MCHFATFIPVDRAYSTFELRSVDDEARIIEGVANSATRDSYDTIIEPEGAVYKLPLPLSFHQGGKHSDIYIGNVIASGVRDGMRWFRAHIPKIEDDGTDGGRSVKFRVDAAWADIKNKLVRGTSIEFIPLEPKTIRAGTRVTKWRWAGLAIVPVPANIDASILTIRSISESSVAASGDPQAPASRAPNNNPRPKMKTYTERIAALENKRAANLARMEALSQKAEDEGRTKDETEQEEFNTLHTEVSAVDTELVDVRALEKLNIAKAVPINGNGTKPASESRGGASTYVSVRSNTEPGIGFARYVMSLVACNNNRGEAAEYARERWGEPGEEIAVQHRNAMMGRAAVAPGTTVQATFAAPLVHVNFLNEFLELLRPQTLVGRIPGLRHVPFNISMPAQTAGGTYKWVGEGKMKPVTNAQFASVTLGMFKASGIIVLTEELVRSSAPSAEGIVRNELVDGITRFLDLQFIDPAIAAVAATNPASITNGVAGVAAGGTTEAFARSDLRALIKTFVTNNIGVDGVVLLMNQAIAFTLGTIVNAVGAPAFPGITAAGGNILGIPVVTSNTITAAVGIVAVHAPSILIADEGGIEIAVSRETSLQLDSAPTEPTDATAVMTSMFQANLVALRVERFISWGKARSTAVDRIHTVAYA